MRTLNSRREQSIAATGRKNSSTIINYFTLFEGKTLKLWFSFDKEPN